MPRTRQQPPTDPAAATNSAVQPPRLATGQAYGARAAAAELQAVAPMGDNSTEAMMAEGAGPGAAMGAAAGADPMAEFVAAAQMAQAGGQGLLAGETTRPDEPITAGLDVGMGPGSDSIPPLAATGHDPSVVLWAQRIPALALLAAQPGSSPQVRQFYRRLRSQLPPDYYANTET